MAGLVLIDGRARWRGERCAVVEGPQHPATRVSCSHHPRAVAGEALHRVEALALLGDVGQERDEGAREPGVGSEVSALRVTAVEPAEVSREGARGGEDQLRASRELLVWPTTHAQLGARLTGLAAGTHRGSSSAGRDFVPHVT